MRLLLNQSLRKPQLLLPKEVTAIERGSSIAHDALEAGPSQCEPSTNSTQSAMHLTLRHIINTAKYATSAEDSSTATIVACIYDRKWQIGIVKQGRDEHDYKLVSFMTPTGDAKQYYWTVQQDVCWIRNSNVLCIFEMQTITTICEK